MSYPYVHRFRDRMGVMRYYFRRHGRRVALDGPPGSAEFAASYAAALAAMPDTAPQKRREPAKPGTFSALAAVYYASPAYKALSPSSRTNYKRVIDGFLVKHGHRPFATMPRSSVAKIIGDMSDRPGAAIILLKRIRTLINFARDLGWMTTDPTARLKSYKSKEIHTWTEEEISQFEKRWKAGSRERLAFELLLYTGQRGSDVHRMTWGDVAGMTIRVAQQKTGEKLTITLHPTLAAELGRTRRSDIAILVTAYGHAFSVKGFGQFVSRAIQGAGLPIRCKAHGLRKAAARRLAEAGCSEKQIASITGHKTLAEVERYTRAANQELLARQAIEKQTGTSIGKPKARLAGATGKLIDIAK